MSHWITVRVARSRANEVANSLTWSGPVSFGLGVAPRASIKYMPIATTAFSHVRLTVTDIARSRAFYDAIFGLPVAFELDDHAPEAARQRLGFLFGGVIYRLGDSLLGLRPVGNGSFDEDRVGLDHLSFAVESRSDLDEAASLLDHHGVAHAGVKEVGTGYILEFRDPDNIALELFAPAPSAPEYL